MVDLENIAKSTRRYNFHSHTQFCDGKAEMEDFVEAALKSGFEHYGFSPHSPVPVDSPCNMSEEDVPAYFAEVERLKDKYLGRIKLYSSMEIDFLGNDWGAHIPYFQELALDYRLSSVHFVPDHAGGFVDIDGSFPGFKEKMARYFDNDIEGVVKSFFSQTEKMLELGGFEICGHLDKIAQNASLFRPGITSTGWYKKLMNRCLDAVEGNGCLLEVNTKAYELHGRYFPGTEWFGEITRRGIKTVVNSDVHRPHLMNAGRGYAFELLDAEHTVGLQ